MKLLITILLVAISSSFFAQSDSLFIRKLYDEALGNGHSYKNLRSLCKDIGARVTGSAEAEMAVKWSERLLKSYNFDKVYLQEVKVPHWERGTLEAGWVENENGDIHKLNVLALGGSIATNGLLSGQVVVFENLDALKKASEEQVKGKVVFLNQAFDQKLIRTFSAYGGCYSQRGYGAIEASKKGAVGVVIRSLASSTDIHPHTGTMKYEDETKKIPAAAISTVDADVLTGWLKKGEVTLSMEMDCKTLPDIISYNVIAEIHGKDDKVITWGGHLDSWDVGEGAHDDGAGVAHSIEALRLLKKVGYQPNHKLRCVLFMNEENGNFGGKGYADWCFENKEEHIAAIESDRGGFLPVGFDVSGTKEHLEFVQGFTELLFDFHLYSFQKGYSGVDIGPLKDKYPNMIQLGMAINSQEYFNYHHSRADVFEAVNKRELELGAAAMATMVYLLDKYLEVK